MPKSVPSYHHGDLRNALIEATEALLVERGPEHFSLREVARRAGVSAGAPAHHFGDTAGLLTAVAAQGFAELTQALQTGDARGHDAHTALREQGVEYVAWALRRPGRFRLMFRKGLLRPDPTLEAHAGAAFGMLENGVRRAFGVTPGQALDDPQRHALLALWSLVHGYAHLASAGRFDAVAQAGGLDPFVDATVRSVLEGVLAGVLPAAPAAPATSVLPGRTRARRGRP